MTVTNDERRKVAARLRDFEQLREMFAESNICAFEVALGVDYMDWEHICDRLAELIEPDCDLTCELEPTASERADAPVRVYECDCCGRSCDSVYAEDYVYCPFCGRLNTAREVEVEE